MILNPERGDRKNLKMIEHFWSKKVTKIPKSLKGWQKVSFRKFEKSVQTSEYPNHSNEGKARFPAKGPSILWPLMVLTKNNPANWKN